MRADSGSVGRSGRPAKSIGKRLAAGTALCLIAIAPAAALRSAPAGAATDFYGVVTQDGGAPTNGDLDLIRSGGAGSIRLVAHWPTIEANRGTYDWSSLDGAVRAAVGHGLRPIVFLWGTPAWAAASDGYACPSPGACSTYAPASAETRAAFAAFAEAAVRRYGPGGDFWNADSSGCGVPLPVAVPVVCPDEPGPPCRCDRAAPLRVWQIWNEQNSPTYYAPAPDVAGYAELLAAAASAIRSVDPEAELVLGGMWGPSNGERPVVPVSVYLKRLYRIAGTKSSFDSIAIHPYAANLRGVRNQMRVARRTVRRAGDRKAGTWVTELGWASHGPAESPYVVGLDGQARLLTRSFSLLESRQRAYRLRGVFWYAWRDKAGGSTICDWCANAGLRDNDGSAKPAWDAFVRVVQ
jgi:hypothetical protein